MMKNIIPVLLLMLITIVSCDETVFEKPEKLIDQDKMIEMMIDIHLAEATFQSMRSRDSLIRNSSSTDFYYSVLKQYNVTDTVFEKSYIYYASQPKLFEKMYRDVMNHLNEMEQEYSGRKNDALDLGNNR